MKTFGQVIVEARKATNLTQKAVARQLRRGDGRKVLPPYLNDLEHDRRRPPEDAVILQLAKILKISADVLYFYAIRVPDDLRRDSDDSHIRGAYQAFRTVLNRPGRVPYSKTENGTAYRKNSWL
jgi:transcriptional regulator with XRE-family HTH domain